MNAHATKLDTAKFRKVHSLMAGGSTEGERAAARARAEAMAKRAGLSLQQAVSSLDAPTQKKQTNIFEGFDDWMEEKEPGYKAEKTRKRTEREERRAVGRVDACERYGSEAAVFDASDRERLLSEAVKPLATWGTYTDHLGRSIRYTTSLDGVRFESWHDLPNLSARVRVAVETAYPMPSSLGGMLEEWRYWRALEADREFFVDEWHHNTEVNARIAIIEHRLNHQPVSTWDDMQARLDWWENELQRDFSPSPEEERRLKDRISADFAILRCIAATSPARDASEGVVSGNETYPSFDRRTNAAKGGAVKDLLQSSPELSNREIGRRIGVSPQTVANWRERIAQADMASEGRMEA